MRDTLLRNQLGIELPDFVRPYYAQLRSDCEAAGLRLEIPPESAATWHDLYRMEVALLKVCDENELRRYAWVVRTRFRDVAGDAAYQTYLNSSPPDQSNAPRDVVLADLVTLVRRTYYLTVLTPASENIRQRLLLGAVALSAVVIAIVVLLASFHRQNQDILLIVLLAGGAGGTMSLIQRVQSLPGLDPILFRLSGRAVILQSLIIPPLSGMIFAVVLYMMFIGKIISADFVPRFTDAPPNGHKGVEFSKFFDFTNAKDSQSFALTIVWAFIAGFAERFVPDAIGRLTAAQRSKTETVP